MHIAYDDSLRDPCARQKVAKAEGIKIQNMHGGTSPMHIYYISIETAASSAAWFIITS
jgi:hypothetical protein